MDFFTLYSELLFGKDKQKFFVKVKPSAKKTEILGVVDIPETYSISKALYISVKEKPENNKANKAIIKFFRQKSALNVLINSGQNAKLKVLELVK